MSKKVLTLLAFVVWAFSAYSANQTDWFTNLTPPMHMALATWFGVMSVVLGVCGLFIFGRILYANLSSESLGIKKRSQYDY